MNSKHFDLPELAEPVRPTVGSCKPSGYPEYDSLTGYVTKTYTMEWEDTSGNRWRKTCTVINLGRPDRGTPVDPDALMVEESMPVERMASAVAQQKIAAAIAAQREERHAKARKLLGAYMIEHGPSRLPDLLPAVREIGWTNLFSLREHINMFPETYLLYWGNPQMWGLHGQEFTSPKPHRHQAVEKLQQALLTHGPMLAGELHKAARVGVARRFLDTLLKKNEGTIFVKVGRKRVPGSKEGAVWGLVGVHDREAA